VLRRVSGNSGVAASSESPSLKSWTGAARFRSRSRSISANLGLQIDCVQGVPVNVRSLGSAVSRFHISPLKAVKPVDIALTSNAAQVAGLGRIFIGLICVRLFSDSRESELTTVTFRPPFILTLDNSLFVLLYWLSTYAAEKIRVVSSFPKVPRDVHKRRAASIAFAIGN
jgi:hypothetical protein